MGPILRASSPPNMKKFIPTPSFLPAKLLMMTGAGTCQKETLMPTRRSIKVRNVFEGDSGRRLIKTAVVAGATITR